MTRMLESLKNTMEDLQEQQAVIEEEINVIGQQIQDLEERIQTCRFRLGVVAEDKERVLAMKDRYSQAECDTSLPLKQTHHGPEQKKFSAESTKTAKGGPTKPDQSAKAPAKSQWDKSFSSSSFKGKDALGSTSQSKDSKLSLGSKKEITNQGKGAINASNKSPTFSGKSTSQFSKFETKASSSSVKPSSKPISSLPSNKEETQAQSAKPANEVKEPKPSQTSEAFTPPSFIYSAANPWDSHPTSNQESATNEPSQEIVQPAAEAQTPSISDLTPNPVEETPAANDLQGKPETAASDTPEPKPEATLKQTADSSSQTTIDLGSGDEKANDDDTVKSINEALRGLFR